MTLSTFEFYSTSSTSITVESKLDGVSLTTVQRNVTASTWNTVSVNFIGVDEVVITDDNGTTKMYLLL
jgi:hypothetical protein